MAVSTKTADNEATRAGTPHPAIVAAVAPQRLASPETFPLCQYQLKGDQSCDRIGVTAHNNGSKIKEISGAPTA
jgi:hypothetical protein